MNWNFVFSYLSTMLVVVLAILAMSFLSHITGLSILWFLAVCVVICALIGGYLTRNG